MLDFLKNIFSSKAEPPVNMEELLARIQPKIASYAKDCIKIETQLNKGMHQAESKFGGLPCFPVGMDLPMDVHGLPMRLLAQLNFSDMPHLPPYPKSGLLQFYLADGDMYGLDFDDPQKQVGWRVIYFEDLNFEPRKDWTDVYSAKWRKTPLKVPELSLTFKLGKDYPSYPAMEYDDWIEPLFKGDYEDELSELYLDKEISKGHKTGGYPFYTQNEMRYRNEAYQSYELLFQMDSENSKIMWGDMGVANFFIKKTDLMERKFDQVLYNWDCY